MKRNGKRKVSGLRSGMTRRRLKIGRMKCK